MTASADSKEAALAAAAQAMEASAELVRFVREGPQYRRPPFGDVEVVEQLADALKTAIEVENAECGDGGHPDDAAMRNRLLGALAEFLEGWAG